MCFSREVHPKMPDVPWDFLYCHVYQRVNNEDLMKRSDDLVRPNSRFRQEFLVLKGKQDTCPYKI
jgi:hypothetical protein